MKTILASLFLLQCILCLAQKHSYDVVLFGKKVGSTVVEKTDKGNGEVHYKLNSSSEVNMLFTHKTSTMNFDVVYKNGKLFSSYVKNVKDGVSEIITMVMEGTEYLVKKGTEMLRVKQQLDFSSIHLYFSEPLNKTYVFSERLGKFCAFKKTAQGEYRCDVDGVTNIYRYKNGVLYELEMIKGASVFLKLVQ